MPLCCPLPPPAMYIVLSYQFRRQTLTHFSWLFSTSWILSGLFPTRPRPSTLLYHELECFLFPSGRSQHPLDGTIVSPLHPKSLIMNDPIQHDPYERNDIDFNIIDQTPLQIESSKVKPFVKGFRSSISATRNLGNQSNLVRRQKLFSTSL